MKKIVALVVFLVLVCLAGILIELIFLLLKITGRVKVFHFERFPQKEPFLLIANHPSLIDPFLALALFLPSALFHPLKLVPFNTPDKKNFYDPWYFIWIRPFSIPIDRNSRDREKAMSLLEMKKILENEKRIILFPEGGRTYKGVKFLYSKRGKRIRKLAKGAGWLAVETGVLVVPVWLEKTDEVLPNTRFGFPRFWKRILIKIGNPLEFNRSWTKEKATEKIEEVLLNLADEEG